MPGPLATSSYVARGMPLRVTAWPGPSLTVLPEPPASRILTALPTAKPNSASRTSMRIGKSSSCTVQVRCGCTQKLWLPLYTTLAPLNMTSRTEYRLGSATRPN